MHTPTWFYRILITLLSPLLLLHVFIRTQRDGNSRYLRERLGFPPSEQNTVQTQPHYPEHLWVHAASVGEIMTVLPLLHSLEQSAPGHYFFIMTTNTPTAAQVLNEHCQLNYQHSYLPIDFRGATQRFITRHRIDKAWVVETEIWPWLFARCNNAGIPLSIINARLSEKSTQGAARLLHSSYKRALENTHILARSNQDAERFLQLGAKPELVRTIGNLKFAPKQNTPLDLSASLLPQPYCLAASTHHDEEIQLAQAWLEQPESGLLVIVPRHPERGKSILKSLLSLQSELSPELPAPRLRSLDQQPSYYCRLYVADTLGELNNWYAFARCTFIGGSLIKHGGQNVLEAASHRCAMFVGPHTKNFSDAVAALQQADGIATAEDAIEVAQLMKMACEQPQWATQMGENAYNLKAQFSQVLEDYITALSKAS